MRVRTDKVGTEVLKTVPGMQKEVRQKATGEIFAARTVSFLASQWSQVNRLAKDLPIERC